MDILIVVRIKSSYDNWKAVFDADPAGRKDFIDETRTLVGKVDDKTAMVQLFDVDMEKMSQMMKDPNSPVADFLAEHVIRQDIYKIEQMSPPNA